MGRDVSGPEDKSKLSQGSPEKSENNIGKVMAADECQQVVVEAVVSHEPMEDAAQSLNAMKLSSPTVTTSELVNGNSVCSHSRGSDKKMMPNSHIMERKHHYLSTRSHYDEDDNWSLSSSTATSIRTTKTTVAVAPRFNCTDRLQRRKEFYSKLAEKHKALEKEKHDYEDRIKEEDQAALRLMRKNMSYKANPVPSFYREGPPPKAELKKIPVTRAKSPNFTRRKSCGDAGVTKPAPPAKAVVSRHSLGATKPAPKSLSPLGPKSKTQHGSGKIRATRSQTKETSETENIMVKSK